MTVLSSGKGIHDAAREISVKAGRPVRALECDITDAAAVKAALAGFGRIDVLVNNAGLERITPLLDPDEAVEETFRRITDINTNGTFYVTRNAVPHMVGGGRIIVTASIWSRVAVPEFSAYITSKHANLGFTRVMAKELGPRGIRVNAVCPGWVRTEAALLSLKTYRSVPAAARTTCWPRSSAHRCCPACWSRRIWPHPICSSPPTAPGT